MRFSVGLPTCMEGMMYPVPFAQPEDLIQIAQLAETLGYHSVWGNDHMTTQHYVKAEYKTPPNFWEILITLAVISAKTTRIKVGTGVLIPAMRQDIVVVAKQITTLDQFSGGRLLLGLGVGAYREEFEALQPGREVKRGKLLEEFIQVLDILFKERNASWEGTYFHFRQVEMYPKPLQATLPVYIGGNNPNAIRRAAQYGQGWMGAGMPLHQMRPAVERLKQLAVENGREPEDIEVAPQFVVCIDQSHDKALQRFVGSQLYRHLVSLSGTTLKDQVKEGVKFEEMDLIGSPDEISSRVQAYREVGVDHICGILFTANSVVEYKEQMCQFAEQVMTNFK